MTKKELVEQLEEFPDDWEVKIICKDPNGSTEIPLPPSYPPPIPIGPCHYLLAYNI